MTKISQTISVSPRIVSHHTLPFVPHMIVLEHFALIPNNDITIPIQNGNFLGAIRLCGNDLEVVALSACGTSREIKFVSEEKESHSIIVSISPE